jgi:hypothetical protein
VRQRTLAWARFTFVLQRTNASGMYGNALKLQQRKVILET